MQIMIFPTEKVGHILVVRSSPRDREQKGHREWRRKRHIAFYLSARLASPCFVCVGRSGVDPNNNTTHRCRQPADQSGREGPQVSRTLPHQRVSVGWPWSAIVAARQIICADWFEALALRSSRLIVWELRTSQRPRRHENLIAFSTHVANAAKITSRAARKLTVIYYQSVADWNALCTREMTSRLKCEFTDKGWIAVKERLKKAN